MKNKLILKGHEHQSSINEKELYQAYKLFFNTFSSEQRIKILNLLRKKPMNVSEVINATGFEQTIVSHSLRRLKSCGFVESESKGKFRYYNVNSKTIKQIMDLIDKHMQGHCLLIIKGLKKRR